MLYLKIQYPNFGYCYILRRTEFYIMNITSKTPRETEKEIKDARALARKNASPFEKIGAFLFFGFLISAVIYGVWDYFAPDSTTSNCRVTTKEVQTIRKLDGGVSSVDTEIVYGCEYPDGTFIPEPDLR